MIRSIRAELVKLCRRRVLVITGLLVGAYSSATTVAVLAAASPTGAAGRGATLQSLSSAGGGTEIFTLAASFAGTFLFVVFVGAFAIEFSRGTFRTMLLREPRRLHLLAGKLIALLAFAGVALAAAEILTWSTAKVLAPAYDLSTGSWVSVAGLGHGLADLGTVLCWVAGYALLGMALGVIARSVPVALAIGVAWAGPIEHIVADAWAPANRFFPGLLLEAFVAGGTPDVSAARALATVAAYIVVATAVAGILVVRRDVTA